MVDWLKITEDDIARTPSLAQPAILTIQPADLDPPLTSHNSSPHLPISQSPLKITPADLQPAAPQPIAPPSMDALETVMFNLVNTARQEHLPRWMRTRGLKWHPGLAAVARGHSADMFKRQYIDHKTPEGKTAAQRIASYGIHYMACGENIGVAYGITQSEAGIQDIHRAFMNQPSGLTNHRGNLLNPLWTHVGIGVAYHPGGTLIITQNFISAPGGY